MTTFPTAIPAGSKLRVGDQGGSLRAPLDLSGQSAGMPYSVDWSTFASGPIMLEAFRAGALDLGFVADTPPIIAAASGQDLAVVASWQTSGDALSLVTRPGSDIHSLRDLKGKKVAYTVGSILQAFALRSLDSVGLRQRDITQVNLLPSDVSSALKRGDADVGVLVQPLTTTYLRDDPTARTVVRGDSIAPYTQYLISTHKTLDDPARAAAVGDFVKRWVRASAWRDGHVDDYVQKYYVEQQKTPADIGRLVLDTAGPATFVPINDSVVGAAQKLADLFTENGVIPKKIDVGPVFDVRYNSAIREAQQ